MKPVSFDMTPLARALEMPRPEKKPEPAKPGPSARTRRGMFPRNFTPQAGWLSVLAAEQIHALATHVLARHTERGLRTLALTSALAGEGKTTLTLALAEKLASANRRILVIDLDTHRGALSRAARLGGADGAMESSLSNNGQVPFHGYETDCSGVSIMPTGRTGIHQGGTPLLSPDRIANLVQHALERFDIVLLDCPPLLPVAETHVIGEVADAAILVIRAGSTPRETLDQALEEFGKEKFFAAVLNRAKPSDIPYFREVYGYYRRSPD
ncbi:MAG: CpsD/CapB family tyrosine-protein kinase [Planctomycetota bacterium]|jgi:Mrp family chromosome partitioning ATPase